MKILAAFITLALASSALGLKYCKHACDWNCYSNEYHDTSSQCGNNLKCCVPNSVTKPTTPTPTNKCGGGCYSYCLTSEFHDTNAHCPYSNKCCVAKSVTKVTTQKPINPPTKPPTNGPVVVPDGSCGKTKHDLGYSFNRIVGGFKAKEGQFPWQVQVKKGGSHWCGGTLISDKWVLSAAHCFGGPTSNYEFVIGKLDRGKKESSEQVFSAKRIISHENYGGGNMRYDVALIELNGNAIMNANVNTACMPSHLESFGGDENKKTSCIVSGWGALREGDPGPSILNAVQKPVVANTACKEAYSGSFDIYDSNICGGFPEGGKDACQGDSGGPYVCKKDGQPWKIVGVVSWGEGCAKPGKYGVYASVPYFANWIKSIQDKYDKQ